MPVGGSLVAVEGASSSVRLLVVDDDEDLAQLIGRLVAAKRGWSITRAGTVKAAVERLVADRFDLVLVDHSLPDGTGLQVVESIRREVPETPVLFLTGHGSEAIALQAISLGATDYMTKGTTMFDALGERLDALLLRSKDVATAARVVPARRQALVTTTASHSGEKRAGGAVTPERAAQVVSTFVRSKALGAGVFDTTGHPIAASFPDPLDASRVGALALQVHAQIGLIGRLSELPPTGYTLLVDTTGGALAFTTTRASTIIVLLTKERSAETSALLAAFAAELSASDGA